MFASMPVSIEVLLGCTAALLLVLAPAVISLCRNHFDVGEAAGYVKSLKAQQDPRMGVTRPFAKTLDAYVNSFDHAVERKSLEKFDVDRQLGDVRRAAGSVAASVRALAGVLILCGLIITLFKLQGAVGGLRSTFSVLAAQQSNVEGASDTAAQVVQGMSTVASAAHDAFLISLCFISSAAILLLLALRESSRAADVVSQFSDWVYSSYRSELNKLPEQVPLNVVAGEFRASAQALELLTASFGEMTKSFGALQGFADSMDRSRNAIVEAMQRLPAHIQESMGSLSEKFVGSVTEGLTNANQHTQQILLIYGQQQQRINTIQAEVVAIKNFSSQVTQAVAKLDGMPEQVTALAAGVELQSKSLNSFASTVAELAIRVEDLPISGLRQDVGTLAAATDRIYAAVNSVERFGERVAQNTELLRELPETTKGIATAVYQEANNAVAFRASVDMLGDHVKALPVSELRAGIVGLTSAAEMIGNIHAQTIAALAEVTRRSSAFEAAGSDLKARIDEVLKYSNQLAIHQQHIKAGQVENAQKVAESLVQLGGRLQSEIQKLKETPQLQAIEDQLTRLWMVVNVMKVDLNALRNGPVKPDNTLENSSESSAAATGATVQS